MKISYEELVDFEKLEDVYHIIKCNTKHKEKILYKERKKVNGRKTKVRRKIIRGKTI